MFFFQHEMPVDNLKLVMVAAISRYLPRLDSLHFLCANVFFGKPSWNAGLCHINSFSTLNGVIFMEPTMHCPGCGTEAPVTQRFCRSCGFSLEKVPQLVAEQSEELLTSKAAEKLQKRQQKIERWLVRTGIGLAALIALSFLIGLIYLMLAGNLPIVPGIVLLILLLGGFVAGSLGIYAEKLKKTLSRSSSLRSRSLPEREITSKPPLEAFEGPFLSVTERTTNLLDKDDAVETRNERRKKP